MEETKYIRKPLKFFVPSYGNIQETKNPFNKSLKTNTSENLKSYYHRKTYSGSSLSTPNVRIISEKVPKPSTFLLNKELSATLDLPSEINMMEKLKIEEEQKESKSCNLETEYNINMTPEAAEHLKVIELLEPVKLSEIIDKMIQLPPSSFKKTLILDLDGTLLHAQRAKMDVMPIKEINMVSPIQVLLSDAKGKNSEILEVYLRPFLGEFLKEMKQMYEIVLFTAAQEGYARTLVNFIDPDSKIFDYILCRTHCVVRHKHFIKDLRIITNRSLKNIVIVDNSIISFYNQMENGVYIPTFSGESDDAYLQKLIPCLKKVAENNSVQNGLSKMNSLPKLAVTKTQ